MAYNTEQIRREILGNEKIKIEAQKLAEKILQESKAQLIKEFDDHAVTKEIEAGPNAANQSSTLGGVGNLFSFIGFSSGDDPVGPVRQLLNNIKLKQSSGVLSGNTIQYKVEMPTDKEFEAVSRMPWEQGRSWLFDIEKSISGLGQYLYGKFQESRSGSGLQSNRNISGKNFRPVKYFTAMLSRFKSKLKE